MYLSFDIENYERVYNKLVNELDFERDIFQTDDVLLIDEDDYETIVNALPDVEFTKS